MELYVCYGTFGLPTVGRHPCAKAYAALTAAGHLPDVLRTFGCACTDRLFSGRKQVNRLTGNYQVPTLVLDANRVIDGSEHIVAWASANPAAARTSDQHPSATSKPPTPAPPQP